MFSWDKDKNKLLKKQRGISFEDIVEAIYTDVLDVYDHPNQEKYPNQKIYVVEVLGYVYLVPFITNGDEKFLKTIIPSRKAKKIYKG
jgi:uncharacterized DUF497 family protein